MKHIKSFVLFCTVAIGIYPTTARADDAAGTAKPISPWRASLKDDICSLQQTFSYSGHQVVLNLQLGAPDKAWEISVVSDGIGRAADPPLV